MSLCENNDCFIRASFNYIDQKARFCTKHKKENMVNVKNKQCIIEGCITRPCFNFNGFKPIFCSKHKIIGMVNLVSKM